MANRNELVKTVAVTIPTYNRLTSHKEYHETMEGVILKLLDIADKYDMLINPPRTRDGKYKKRR